MAVLREHATALGLLRIFGGAVKGTHKVTCPSGSGPGDEPSVYGPACGSPDIAGIVPRKPIG